MAGLGCAVELKFKSTIFRMCAVLMLIVCLLGVSADSESSVQTVADTNWTLILQGEWMVKL